MRERELMSAQMARRKLTIRMRFGMLALSVGMGMGLLAGPCVAAGQGGQQSGENPFPGQPVQTPGQVPGQASGQAKPSGTQSGGAAAKPVEGGDNPFPGEANDAPILTVAPEAKAVPRGTSAFADGGTAAADPDGDPVSSPDLAGGGAANDGFSSSRSGLGRLPMEDSAEGASGKGGKQKSKEQVLKEDVDVGNFYLDRKNWRAAQTRFVDAFALNVESPEAVLGLAVSEQHLQLLEKAREHFLLFLSYDPEGPRSRGARKGLEQVEAAIAAGGGAQRGGAGSEIHPK